MHGALRYATEQISYRCLVLDQHGHRQWRQSIRDTEVTERQHIAGCHNVRDSRRGAATGEPIEPARCEEFLCWTILAKILP